MTRATSSPTRPDAAKPEIQQDRKNTKGRIARVTMTGVGLAILAVACGPADDQLSESQPAPAAADAPAIVEPEEIEPADIELEEIELADIEAAVAAVTTYTAQSRETGLNDGELQVSTTKWAVDDAARSFHVTTDNANLSDPGPPLEKIVVDGMVWTRNELTAAVAGSPSGQPGPWVEATDEVPIAAALGPSPRDWLSTLGGGRRVEAAGLEVITGVETARINFEISTQTIAAIVAPDLAQEDIPDTWNTATIWADRSALPVRFMISGDEESSVTIDFGDWGNPVDIAPPPESEQAAPDFTDQSECLVDEESVAATLNTDIVESSLTGGISVRVSNREENYSVTTSGCAYVLADGSKVEIEELTSSPSIDLGDIAGEAVALPDGRGGILTDDGQLVVELDGRLFGAEGASLSIEKLAELLQLVADEIG